MNYELIIMIGTRNSH